MRGGGGGCPDGSVLSKVLPLTASCSSIIFFCRSHLHYRTFLMQMINYSISKTTFPPINVMSSYINHTFTKCLTHQCAGVPLIIIAWISGSFDKNFAIEGDFTNISRIVIGNILINIFPSNDLPEVHLLDRCPQNHEAMFGLCT